MYEKRFLGCILGLFLTLGASCPRQEEGYLPEITEKNRVLIGYNGEIGAGNPHLGLKNKEERINYVEKHAPELLSLVSNFEERNVKYTLAPTPGSLSASLLVGGNLPKPDTLIFYRGKNRSSLEEITNELEKIKGAYERVGINARYFVIEKNNGGYRVVSKK